MPARVLIILALAGLAQTGEKVTLEVRVFSGMEDVTGETRISVHHAGDRRTPIAQLTPQTGKLELAVTPDIYDVQAIQERDGRVRGIRWAERLVVMAYPDEKGRHLEVVNLQPGFGALQVRARQSDTTPLVALYGAGQRTKEAAARIIADGYVLFVVPAGRYDIRLGEGNLATWHADIDVPLDRTRLWMVPEAATLAGRSVPAARRRQAR